MAAQQVPGTSLPARHYVFGPVPSRRLGRSLGIDTIPLKTCNWNCVYCQLGRSEPLVNERKEYIPRQDILAEVEEVLARLGPDAMDWVTFVGSGEPTLHAGIGWLIREVKKRTPAPVAVITNGSLLYLPEVREELAAADAVMPTLDAGEPALYRQINRPWPELTFERLVEGLRAFRDVYEGQLWVEVMLVRGMNDGEEALQALARTLRPIRPDQIHILLPVRPPAETWVQPADEAGVLRALALLGDVAPVLHPQGKPLNLSGFDRPLDAILEVIARHPLREDHIRQALPGWSDAEIDRLLADLAASGRAQPIIRYGVRFWTASGAHFPSPEQSRRTRPGSRRKPTPLPH